MLDVKYVGTKKLSGQDLEDLEWVMEFYRPKFERQLKRGLLTVGVKGSHMMGKVGRFTINLLMDSPNGKRMHTDQSGWGFIKTTRRACEHMMNMLEHNAKKDMLAHKPRDLKKKPLVKKKRR